MNEKITDLDAVVTLAHRLGYTVEEIEVGEVIRMKLKPKIVGGLDTSNIVPSKQFTNRQFMFAHTGLVPERK